MSDSAAHQAPLSSTVSQSLLKLMSIELMMLSNHLILCCPLLLPSIFPSIRVFSSDLALCIRWPKYWSFSISTSSEFSGLISFRINWFELLVVQGTLKSSPTPQFKSISSSVFSLLYGPAPTSTEDYWKNYTFDYIVVCWQNDVSCFLIRYLGLSRNKHLLISRLQSLSPVILEPWKIKFVTVSTFSPYVCHEVIRLDTMILVF